MSGLEELPQRSSARARWHVAGLAMRALLQVVLLVPRLLRESAASAADPEPPGTAR